MFFVIVGKSFNKLQTWNIHHVNFRCLNTNCVTKDSVRAVLFGWMQHLCRVCTLLARLQSQMQVERIANGLAKKTVNVTILIINKASATSRPHINAYSRSHETIHSHTFESSIVRYLFQMPTYDWFASHKRLYQKSNRVAFFRANAKWLLTAAHECGPYTAERWHHIE